MQVRQDSDAALMRAATFASAGVAVFLIIIKLIAYVLTGSVTLLSSLLDSVLDCIASIINFIAVRHALEPADKDHRFGHGKAEALAGFSQAGFIIGSSAFLLFEAVLRLKHPHPIAYANIGIIVILISIVATFILVRFQRYVYLKTGSVAIKADSIHYFSDFLLNALVIISLIIVTELQIFWLDSVLAILIAIYILFSARTIAMQSVNQLMDKELSDEQREQIMAIVNRHKDVLDMHQLRTRSSGRKKFIQFHLGLRHDLSLNDAHQISNAVRQDLLDVFPEADILIHEQPIETES